MPGTFAFLKEVVDSITDHLVVLDDQGDICFTNQAWQEFGRIQHGVAAEARDWTGINYLATCDAAAAAGDSFGQQAGLGIRQVMQGERKAFYFEYPCHGPGIKRWFMMRVTPFDYDERRYFIIAHQNITERKLAEERSELLARIDELTGLANRRHFQEHYSHCWYQCQRDVQPLTVVMLDIDHFKLLNDTYGHEQGDHCLRELAALLENFSRRPSDFCARYGGEEFVLVFAEVTAEQVRHRLLTLLEQVRALEVPNEGSSSGGVMTISMGAASCVPTPKADGEALIRRADEQLYRAKEQGRDQLCFRDFPIDEVP
jgi:diguanylate cyclase (GGDEF)-like protein